MKKFFLSVGGLLLSAVIASVHAAPSEVLSQVSFVKQDGMDAVRVDFAIPVHYVSHTPNSRGKRISIIIK